MKKKFWKYQGTGNDFIFFDGREDVSAIKGNRDLIARLCNRRFGIGADGLIILEKEETADFRMIYYNSDGGESSMCGNGGRCSIAFAKLRGFSELETRFEAIDGMHSGKILKTQWVELGMIDVSEIARRDDRTFVLNTGSPHYVSILEGDATDIFSFGREIRYSSEFEIEGINVNTVQIIEGGIKVETYERGVEGQTLSCGTGVTACAIAYYEFMDKKVGTKVSVATTGGDLKVSFDEVNGKYSNIVLSGPAKLVFEGEIEL